MLLEFAVSFSFPIIFLHADLSAFDTKLPTFLLSNYNPFEVSLNAQARFYPGVLSRPGSSPTATEVMKLVSKVIGIQT